MSISNAPTLIVPKLLTKRWKCQAKNRKTLATGQLQAASYYVAAQIPAGEKQGFSQGNAVLRFMEQAFGDHLSVKNLLKKI